MATSRIIKTVYPITPNQLKTEMPLDATQKAFVTASQQRIADIITLKTPGFIVAPGACSWDTVEQIIRQVEHDVEMQSRYKKLEHLTRIYGGKSRTMITSSSHWKGTTYDPHYNCTYDFEYGLRITRQACIEAINRGVGVIMELIDISTWRYFQDVVSYFVVGARNSAAGAYRDMVSEIPITVGQKNPLNGDLVIAAQSVATAQYTQAFMSLDMDNKGCFVQTTGNPLAHLILRGGGGVPNYSHNHLAQATEQLDKLGVTTGIGVCASHENSGKNPKNHPKVITSLAHERRSGNLRLVMATWETNAPDHDSRTDRGDTYQQDEKYRKELNDAVA